MGFDHDEKHATTSTIIGAGAVNVWMPDAPPIVPHAQDDEFNDENFNTSKWTEWDVMNKITIVEQEWGLEMTVTTDPGINWGGVYQSVPTGGDFSMMAKIDMLTTRFDTFSAGLFLAEDLDAGPSTANLVTLHLAVPEGALTVNASEWSAYDAFLVTRASDNITDYIIPHIYLRIRVVGSDYEVDYSINGLSWNFMHGEQALPFTPVHCGIAVNNQNTGETSSTACSFFRIVEGTGTHRDVLRGRQVSITSF
jgi:hypothetical protein